MVWRKSMRAAITIALLAAGGVASAGGWSNAAVPQRVDIERGNGLMIYGSFGNSGSCVVSDAIYVKIDHPQYKQIYSAVMAALAGKLRIQAYVATCESVSWYSLPSVTYNIADLSSAVNVMN
jgi:hypothetical protein